MEPQIVVPLFSAIATVFLIVINSVMKSPEQEEKECQQEGLEREMREFLKRQSESNCDKSSETERPS